jgi:hypothetical protein
MNFDKEMGSGQVSLAWSMGHRGSVRCQWSVVRCGKTQNKGWMIKVRRQRSEVRRLTTEDSFTRH